jgi:lipoate-protein ligase B
VKDTVLLVEHPPTITLGRREEINTIAADRETLGRLGITLVETDRGGGATAHNPGQLVVYPIIDLGRRSMPVDVYIHLLEDVGLCLLKRLDVTADRREGFPGLWVGDGGGRGPIKKIASIGIHLAGMVTAHGMAINIQNDLSIFAHIVPCGLEGVSLTSVKEVTGIDHDMGEVKGLLAGCVKGRLAPGD